ncbi:MAG: GNAT family N-acetyltransferase [Patescibacteria group bacterium]|nr:GNAT family N-acetyltransferase [Patescibacteria group bacterium]
MKIKLRYQKLSDAERFCEILNNPNFIYFNAKPTLNEEIKWLKEVQKKVKNNYEHNYTILYDNKVVGGIGIKINQHCKFVGEIGYFLDEKYWGKGITCEAVRLVEEIAFKELDLKRIEILTDVKNEQSQRVAKKCGYEKEGVLKKRIINQGKNVDAILFAKVK